MKPSLVVLIFVAVGAGAAWWSLSDRVDQDAVNSDPSSLIAEPAGEPAGTKASVLDVSDSVASEPADNAVQLDEESDAEVAKTTQEDTSNTPFAVVENEGQIQEAKVALQDQLAETASATDNNASGPRPEIQNAPRAVVPVEVPSSYPVTEADKYFIPKEERGPGRLGGPPPLNFPGGPSDPDRSTDQELQPPVAPGQ